MKVSIAQDNVNFKEVEVADLGQLLEFKLSSNVAPGVFESNYRKKKNFKAAYIIGLDFDGTITKEDAIARVDGYAYAIIQSRSKSPKSYHLFLQLEEPITDPNLYITCLEELFELFPEADKKCNDVARQFFASGEDADYQWAEGKGWPVAIPEGGRNSNLFNLASRFRHDGNDDAESIYEYVSKINNKYCSEPLSDEEIQQIASSAASYESDSDIDDMTIEDILRSEETEYLVDNLLPQDGISIIAADPKVGKSTLIRQLCIAISTGGEFLGRQCSKGLCHYLALEESVSQVKKQLIAQGVYRNNNLRFKFDSIKGDSLEYLERYIMKHQPKLIVCDTINLVTKLDTLNDYALVTKTLGDYRELARRSGCHIMFIAHTNKTQDATGTARIMGSNGLRGAVDCSIVIERSGIDRVITSEGRDGEQFDETSIRFNRRTQTYELGKSNEKRDF